MADVRYSVMVLPHHGDAVLLQSFTSDTGSVTWDGFGTFYDAGGTALAAATKVVSDKFELTPAAQSLHEAARLNYFMDKPAGLVDLRITIYFLDADDNLPATAQMTWFGQDEVPYRQMHQATGKWLPIILARTELLTATIKVEQPGDHTTGKVTEFTVN